MSPVLRSYFTISDHGGAAAVIDPPAKLMFMKLTGEVNSTRSPFAAASTSALACAISSAFCSGVTIALPPPRPPPPPPPPRRARARSGPARRRRQRDPDHRRQRLVDDVELAAVGIDRAGPEVGAAVVSRHLHRAFEARRREQPLVAIRPQPRAQLVLRLLRQVRVDVLLGERLLGKRRRLRRERLRGGRPLAGHVGLRNRPLLDRPDRLAGLPIEDVEEPLLRRLRDDLARLAVLADRQQLGRLRNVPVPEVVVNELLMPDPLAGAGVDRDERVGEQVVALAIAAVEVVARAAEADERDAVLLVDGELAPVVPAAADLLVAFRPRVVAELPFVRNDMEDPGELPGPHVVGMDVGGRAAVARLHRAAE